MSAVTKVGNIGGVVGTALSVAALTIALTDRDRLYALERIGVSGQQGPSGASGQQGVSGQQ